MRPCLPVVWTLVALAGCSIESGGLRPDPGGRVDAAVDAALSDADETPDARPLDAGLDGGELPVDAGDRTDTGTTECEDGPSSCSPDGTELLGCAGGRITRLACAAGCDPDALDCRDVPSCGLAVHGDLVPGTDEEFTLCGEGNDVSPRGTSECTAGANGEDRMYRIVLDRLRTVRVDLRDNDSNEAIDTVVHIRAACEDGDSQVACEDDIPCEDADPDFGCSGGSELRQSTIEMPLGPGAYWVVADSIDHGTWRCGTVLLRYEWL